MIVSIPDGEVLDGSIPISKMKLLQAWIEPHKDELIADWELAVSGQHPLELAVASGVKGITTFNMKDFKRVEEFGVQVLSPKKLLEEIKWEL